MPKPDPTLPPAPSVDISNYVGPHAARQSPRRASQIYPVEARAASIGIASRWRNGTQCGRPWCALHESGRLLKNALATYREVTPSRVRAEDRGRQSTGTAGLTLETPSVMIPLWCGSRPRHDSAVSQAPAPLAPIDCAVVHRARVLAADARVARPRRTGTSEVCRVGAHVASRACYSCAWHQLDPAWRYFPARHPRLSSTTAETWPLGMAKPRLALVRSQHGASSAVRRVQCSRPTSRRGSTRRRDGMSFKGPTPRS